MVNKGDENFKNAVVRKCENENCRYKECDAWANPCPLAAYRGAYEIDALRREVSALKDENLALYHSLSKAMGEISGLKNSVESFQRMVNTDTQEINDLKNKIKAWKSAIEGLTPGGSEYVNDPERCAEFIRYKCSFPKKMIAMQARIDELEVENLNLATTCRHLCNKECS